MDIVPEWLSAPIDRVTKSNIDLLVLETREAIHRKFAQDIVEAAQNAYKVRGRGCLILPVGPTLQYPLCAQLFNQLDMDLSRLTIIHMDEYVDEGQWIPYNHPLSFRKTMDALFYQRLQSRPQIIFPDPAHIQQVEAAIARAGGVDTAFGGIGIHGHVAFNEPAASPDKAVPMEDYSTRVVTLSPETVVMNASRNWGGWIDGFPRQAVTLGIRELLGARQLTLYADGGVWQRTALRKAVAGERDETYPVTLLTSRMICRIVTDRLTASPITDIV